MSLSPLPFFSASKEDFELFLERAKEWGVNFIWDPLAAKAIEHYISSIPTATTSSWMIEAKAPYRAEAYFHLSPSACLYSSTFIFVLEVLPPSSIFFLASHA